MSNSCGRLVRANVDLCHDLRATKGRSTLEKHIGETRGAVWEIGILFPSFPNGLEPFREILGLENKEEHCAVWVAGGEISRWTDGWSESHEETRQLLQGGLCKCQSF